MALTRKTAFIACTALTCAAALPVTAHAQDAAEAETQGQGGNAIIVTAQKREQRLVDVPAAISVVGAEDLEKFQAASLVDIAGFVPGLQIDSGGTPGQSTISLRGIAALGASQTVGAYIDEAPVGSSTLYARSAEFSTDLLPYDIERIEVLKGPQGTLYGASSIGGLLKYVTRDPDLNTMEIRGGGDLFTIADSGDLGYAARVGINMPVIEGQLAVRGSYSFRHTPGYIDDLGAGGDDVNKYDQQSARIAALWEPTSNFSLEVAGMWQKTDADGYSVTRFDIPEPYLSNTEQVPFGALEPLGDGRSIDDQLPSLFKNEITYLTATAKLDLGFADFLSATSYSDSTTYQYGDYTDVYGVLIPLVTGEPGVSAFYITLDLEKFTQEFRVSAPDGNAPLQWLLGGFYTHEKSGNLQTVTAQDLNLDPIPGVDPLALAGLPSTYDEYAVFGQASYTFAEVFELGGGLRWARNEQDFRQISSSAVGLVPEADDPGSSAESVWTWSAFGRYEVAPSASLYARAATGYRPGGPNVILPDTPTQVDADTLTSYEVGFKADLGGNLASVDMALFQMDWNDIQLSVSNDSGVSYFDNAGKARARGFEFGGSIRPVEGLSIDLNAAYTKSELREDAPSGVGAKGDRLPNIPEFTLSFGPQYAFGLSGDWEGIVAGNIRYVDDRLTGAETAVNTLSLPDYTTLDLSLAATNDVFTVRVYARNVTDEDAYLSGGIARTGFGARNYGWAVPVQPRTVGVALDLRY